MNSIKPQYYLLAEARLSGTGDTSASDSAIQWHFLLESADGSARLDIAEEEPDTPSDRVELLALVRGLEAIDQPARVALITPSRYVSHGLRFGLDQWRENGWQWEAFGQMTPVKNVDLWRRIDQALTIHRVECKSVRHDQPHLEVAQPHTKTAETSATATENRANSTTKVNKLRKPARGKVELATDKKTSLWNSVRVGFAGLLHSLGEVVAPGQVCT